MADIYHQFGADLALSPTGDVATASASTLTQQRVLRRLLTNPGDYIWNLDYGAGLARFVGQPANTSRIAAIIRSQIFKEASVARTPEPTIDVQSGATGTIYVHIRYADATTGETQVLAFQAGA
jgi:phage baseplate assembly protein W